MAKSKGGAVASTRHKMRSKIRRKGVHSKKKSSRMKTSKNYKKLYRAQGK